MLTQRPLVIIEQIELIESGVKPRTILWTALDTFRALEQVETHLASAVEKHGCEYLFIDEVTTVPGWQLVIKKLRDSGVLAGKTVILTGSSAHDLKSGAERMAGRRGEAQTPDRVLLPMPFAEFRRQLERNALASSATPELYFKSGGFPFRVEAAIKRGANFGVLDDFQVFDDVLFYEFARRRLDRSVAIEVIRRLSTVQEGAVSYESFAKLLSVAKDTARKYLDALGDAFLLATISSFDTARGRVAPKKDRKFLWIDPALAFSGLWLRAGEEPKEAYLAEIAVCSELLRRFEARLFEGLSAPRNVYTWKSSGGNEIDFLVIDTLRKIRYPIEVKWQSNVSDWDFQVMERAFGTGTIVTPGFEKKRPKAIATSFERFAVEALPCE